ncbi:hypothetical protein [Thermococcus sp.]
MGDIDIGEAIERPLEIMMTNYGFFVPPLLPAVISLISAPTVGKPGLGLHVSITSIILSMIVMILSLIAGGALVYMADKELRGDRADYGEGLNAAMERIVDLVVASVIIGVGFAVGLILLVIPGLLWLMLTTFVVPMIMLENLDAISAIEKSINLVKENFVTVLVYLVVLAIIIGVGMTLLGLIPYIGYALATIVFNPFAAISITIAYHQLAGVSPEEAPTETF